MWIDVLEWPRKGDPLHQDAHQTTDSNTSWILVMRRYTMQHVQTGDIYNHNPHYSIQLNIHHQTHKLTCKSSNVIYCVTCKKCKDQYIGETEQELHARQRGHLNDIRSNVSGLPYVEHFKVCGIDNYTITAIEKVRRNDVETRRSREAYYKKLFDVRIK